MIHVHTEIVVAEGWQECGNHSGINNTRNVLDQTRSDHGLDYRLERVWLHVSEEARWGVKMV